MSMQSVINKQHLHTLSHLSTQPQMKTREREGAEESETSIKDHTLKGENAILSRAQRQIRKLLEISLKFFTCNRMIERYDKRKQGRDRTWNEVTWNELSRLSAVLSFPLSKVKRPL